MNLKKIGNKEKRLVRCLVAAADAHDELAAAYRKHGWDLSADETEQVARGLRERAKAMMPNAEVAMGRLEKKRSRCPQCGCPEHVNNCGPDALPNDVNGLVAQR
jgi:hypothetical protein